MEASLLVIMIMCMQNEGRDLVPQNFQFHFCYYGRIRYRETHSITILPPNRHVWGVVNKRTTLTTFTTQRVTVQVYKGEVSQDMHGARHTLSHDNYYTCIHAVLGVLFTDWHTLLCTRILCHYLPCHFCCYFLLYGYLLLVVRIKQY